MKEQARQGSWQGNLSRPSEADTSEKNRAEKGIFAVGGTFNQSAVWFGTAVSLAEILTGTELAGLGWRKGIAAILLGHLAGCILLILAGLISAEKNKGSMAVSALSFGTAGSRIFAALNVLQLIGWQGIMIYDAAVSAEGIIPLGQWIWCLIIGVLTVFWLLNHGKGASVLNAITMTALFVLTVLLMHVIFGGGEAAGSGSQTLAEGISFGTGFELSVAMPLSWVPMIGDSTSHSRRPVQATFASCITYSLVSSWMYLIGLGAAIFTGESRIDQIMLKAGLGIAGLFIVVFSCVTTNFIDAFSCSQSTFTLLGSVKNRLKVPEILRSNWPGIVDTIIGTIGAILFSMDSVSGFLYWIGSVFAPMFAVQFADVFILHIPEREKKWDVAAGISWLFGFICYRLLMRVDFVLGNTIPAMLFTMVLTIVVRILQKGVKSVDKSTADR